MTTVAELYTVITREPRTDRDITHEGLRVSLEEWLARVTLS